MNIQQQIRDYIVNTLLFGDGQNLQPDPSFREKGVVDSMGILDLIGFLEKEYAISIEDDDLISENFDTILGMTQFVESKLDKYSTV